MSALLIYFMINAAGKFEFAAIEHVPNLRYCQHLADQAATVFQSKPGNFRIVCAEDRGFEL